MRWRSCSRGPSLRPQRNCVPRVRIAAQHQPIGADFPAFESVEKTHAEQVGFHLAARHDQRRDRALDKASDREAIQRQPRRLGVAADGLERHVVVQQFEREPRRLGGLVGEHHGGRAGVDHHRHLDAVDPGVEPEFAAVAA